MVQVVITELIIAVEQMTKSDTFCHCQYELSWSLGT